MTFLEQLRQHTRPLHDSLERDSQVAAHTDTLPRYRALIAAYYGYFYPLEAQLADFRFSVDATFGGSRARSRFLRQDLEALGFSPAAIAALPLCADLPLLPSRAAAIGCAYVVEGSALGGRVLSGIIHRNLGIDSDTGARYFEGWGEDTGRRWRDFCAEAEAFAAAAAPGETDDAVATAAATFNTLQRWFTLCWERPNVR